MFDRRQRKPGAGPAPVTSAAGVPGRTTRVAESARTGPAAHAAAREGVAGASSSLPHLARIQAAFGRHSVGHIQAAIGGPAAEASAAMGATAYAAGDRVAFAQDPDLHTAAHEAAHVVQQRAGVSLAGGVGASGDVYEQHADRVADLVVRGESAEAALDEMVGGGGAGGGGAAVQRHDTPGHVGIGDSVPGESVKFRGVRFTPGELAALVDYIGDLDILTRPDSPFTAAQIRQMHDLLVRGIEDAWIWDQVTGGMYSNEAQQNEKHFAPSAGDGGQNFRDQFVHLFGQALMAKQGDDRRTGDQTTADLLMYSAEHYLEDAFSAGHQIAAGDVQARVDAVMGRLIDGAVAIPIAHRVFAQQSAVIGKYTVKWTPMFSWPVADDDFAKLATIGALWKGNGGVGDAVRRAVHEDLGGSGVEVTSKAHPTPFTLWGDHAAGAGKSEQSMRALQAALWETRRLLDSARPTDERAAEALAMEHFERHCPVPTATGSRTVETALGSATSGVGAITDAVVETMCATIQDVMDNLVAMTAGATGLAVRVLPPEERPIHEQPPTTIAPFDPYDPVEGRPVDPAGGDVHALPAAGPTASLP